MDKTAAPRTLRPQPALGWVYLSRRDIQRAERQLTPDTEGVRDEIGFLALHQAYANRLFPGTSVLHTRLRYVLFIPWLLQDLARHPGGVSCAKRLLDAEVQLTGRLKQGDDDGVIGGRVHPNPSAQQASAAYWSALGTWGLLLPREDGSRPTRAEALRQIDGARRGQIRAIDDDRQALSEASPLFVSLPPPDAAWASHDKPLTFALSAEERHFLRSRLSAVARSGVPDASLLSRLVESGIRVAGIGQPWHEEVSAVAGHLDRSVLKRASAAASLAAVGRGVYAALVEEWRDRIDRQPTERRHRDALKVLQAEHAGPALDLDLRALRADDPALASDPIVDVLSETQRWLRSRRPAWTLVDLYQEAEHRRKGLRRARLGSHGVNRERRLEWQSAGHPLAEPLHYRWPQVRRLLSDLLPANR